MIAVLLPDKDLLVQFKMTFTVMQRDLLWVANVCSEMNPFVSGNQFQRPLALYFNSLMLALKKSTLALPSLCLKDQWLCWQNFGLLSNLIVFDVTCIDIPRISQEAFQERKRLCGFWLILAAELNVN